MALPANNQLGWGGGRIQGHLMGEDRKSGQPDSKEVCVLLSNKGHLARFCSKGRVTSNKLLPRGLKYMKDCPENVARVEPCKSPGGAQFLWLMSENEGV